ncbi:MAG: tetratricopeptide repeat protein [Holophagales bacterium]|nr:tetratricopeptide repeat protein [Holophagales bacterium]
MALHPLPFRVLLLLLPALAAPFGLALAQSAEPAGDGEDVLLRALPATDTEGLDPAVLAAVDHRMSELQRALQNPERKAVATAFGELGLLYHAHDFLQSAAVCYENAAAVDGSDPRWPYGGALVARELGELEAAGKLYLQSLDILPRNPAGLVGLAEVRLEQGHVELARAYLMWALELLPESPSVLAVLGQVELSEKRYERAVDYFGRALDQRPDADRLHYPLALAYRGLGELDKAREHLDKRGEVGVRPPDMMRDAVEARKTGERVMLLEGRRAFAVGRYAEAVAFFTKAVEAAPESLAARVNLATALASSGEREAAMEQFRTVLEEDPENAACHFNLGVILLGEGKADEALGHLERAVTTDDRDGEAWAQLANARRQVGEPALAKEAYAAALELSPRNTATVLEYAAFLRDLSEATAARDLLVEAYRLDPENGLLAHALARLFATSEDLEVRDGQKALTLAEMVVEAREGVESLRTLAFALAESGKCDEATRAQARALELLPDGYPASEKAAMQGALEQYRGGSPCRPPS